MTLEDFVWDESTLPLINVLADVAAANDARAAQAQEDGVA